MKEKDAELDIVIRNSQRDDVPLKYIDDLNKLYFFGNFRFLIIFINYILI